MFLIEIYIGLFKKKIYINVIIFILITMEMFIFGVLERGGVSVKNYFI